MPPAHVKVVNYVNKKKATPLFQRPCTPQLLSKSTHEAVANLLCINQVAEADELPDTVIDVFATTKLVSLTQVEASLHLTSWPPFRARSRAPASEVHPLVTWRSALNA